MKRKFYFILPTLIFLCLTSCSGLFQTMYYTMETEGWKEVDNHSVLGMAYTYDAMPDTIMLNVRGPGTSAITTGPIFFPFAFPSCILFWIKPEPTLNVDATFYVHQPCTIYPHNIHFTDYEGHKMSPVMIESLDAKEERHMFKLDSTAIVQGIRTSTSTRLRWHFKGKQVKTKAFSILLDAAPTRSNDDKPLCVRFRRITKYKCRPWLTH